MAGAGNDDPMVLIARRQLTRRAFVAGSMLATTGGTDLVARRGQPR